MVFNTRLESTKALSRCSSNGSIHFLPCVVYEVRDESVSPRDDGKCWVLAEPELEGQFCKWNNNAGAVYEADLGLPAKGGFQTKQRLSCIAAGRQLDTIAEEPESEQKDAKTNTTANDADATSASLLKQVPQCFSHFTHTYSGGKKLVCDLQGVWNAVDGYTFTDPVFHSTRHAHKNGPTDKGEHGIRQFFESHECACAYKEAPHSKRRRGWCLVCLEGESGSGHKKKLSSMCHYHADAGSTCRLCLCLCLCMCMCLCPTLTLITLTLTPVLFRCTLPLACCLCLCAYCVHANVNSKKARCDNNRLFYLPWLEAGREHHDYACALYVYVITTTERCRCCLYLHHGRAYLRVHDARNFLPLGLVIKKRTRASSGSCSSLLILTDRCRKHRPLISLT